MFLRSVLCLGLVVLTSCATAKMAMDPGLDVDSDKYQITARPTFFSDSDLVFGPYKATDISRGFIESAGSSTSIGEFKFGKNRRGQDYTYRFNGHSSWNGACNVEKGSSEVSIVTYGQYAEIVCRFVPLDSTRTASKPWVFSIQGESTGTARGRIEIGSKTIEVAAINTIEGSPFAMNQHTGYYFYSGQTIIAGVDAIHKKGPVWLNKQLSPDEKDILAMVAAALLLNQVY